MSEDGQTEDNLILSPLAFCILLISLLTSVGIVATIVAERTDFTFSELTSMLGVLSSIALSAILAYLYYRMSVIQGSQRTETSRQADLQGDMVRSQRKQNELLQRQQELRELEYIPKIQIVGAELTERGIKIKLRNLGRGLAQHIAVRPTLRIDDMDTNYSDCHLDNGNMVYPPEAIIYRDPDTGDEFIPAIKTANRPDDQMVMSKRSQGGMLSPNEEVVTFKAKIRYAAASPEDAGGIGLPRMFPEEFFEYIYNQGAHEVWFNIDLLYTDELGEIYINHVIGSQGELKSGMKLRDMEDLRGRTSGSRFHILNRVEKTSEYPPNEPA